EGEMGSRGRPPPPGPLPEAGRGSRRGTTRSSSLSPRRRSVAVFLPLSASGRGHPRERVRGGRGCEMALLHGKGRLVGWSGVGTQKDAEAVVDVACVGGSAMAGSTAPVEGMAKPGTAARDALGRTDRTERGLDGPVLVEGGSVC